MESSEDKTSGENSWDESVSVLMDNEPTDFDPMNLDMSYGRQVWDQYHLIGDVMRDQQFAFQPSDMFYARLSKALEQEPTHQVKRNLLWPWGLSIAASLVASIGIWLFTQSMTEEPDEMLTASAPMVSVGDTLAARAVSPANETGVGESTVQQTESSSSSPQNSGLYMALGADKATLIREFVTQPSDYIDLTLDVTRPALTVVAAPMAASPVAPSPAASSSAAPSVPQVDSMPTAAADAQEQLLSQTMRANRSRSAMLSNTQSFSEYMNGAQTKSAAENVANVSPAIAADIISKSSPAIAAQTTADMNSATAETTIQTSSVIAAEPSLDAKDSLEQTVPVATTEADHLISQTHWQNNFKTLIEQHERTAGRRLTVPVGLQGEPIR